jgi:hypothetical protein
MFTLYNILKLIMMIIHAYIFENIYILPHFYKQKSGISLPNFN